MFSESINKGGAPQPIDGKKFPMILRTFALADLNYCFNNDAARSKVIHFENKEQSAIKANLSSVS